MLIDCNECEMQYTETCQDCVVTHVLRDLAGPIEVDPDQAEALGVLADAGLVAPLRLIPKEDEGAAVAK
jgi:hypothetical protein